LTFLIQNQQVVLGAAVTNRAGTTRGESYAVDGLAG
jgi:hypothetical protein